MKEIDPESPAIAFLGEAHACTHYLIDSEVLQIDEYAANTRRQSGLRKTEEQLSVPHCCACMYEAHGIYSYFFFFSADFESLGKSGVREPFRLYFHA